MSTELSVVIPTHNRAHTLLEVLQRLAGQTLSTARYEVVVVDDRSDDGTGELLADADFPFDVEYRRLSASQAEPSVSLVRNAGLEACSGDYVLLLDADVIAGERLLESHLHSQTSGGAEGALVTGTTFGNGEPQGRTPQSLQPPAIEAIDLGEIEATAAATAWGGWTESRQPFFDRWPGLHSCPFPFGLIWGHNVSFRRVDALEIGGFDSSFRGWGVEDVEFSYRMQQAGAKVSHNANAKAVHYPHPVGQYESAMRANLNHMMALHPTSIVEIWADWFLKWSSGKYRSLDRLCARAEKAARRSS